MPPLLPRQMVSLPLRLSKQFPCTFRFNSTAAPTDNAPPRRNNNQRGSNQRGHNPNSSSIVSNILNIGLDSRRTTSQDRIRELVLQSTSRTRRKQQSLSKTLNDRASSQKVTEDYMRQMPRPWEAGVVYAPHDLSPAEMGKWKRRKPNKEMDVFDALGINPLDHYRNYSLMSDFMTSMGFIQPPKNTGLRPVNQRKIAKAIRRAIGMGLHPSVHRHPEILQTEFAQRRAKW